MQWSGPDPTVKPRLSGFLVPRQDTRRVTVLLDTGPTHTSSAAGAARRGLAATVTLGSRLRLTRAHIRDDGRPWGTQDLPAPMLAHLGLGDTFREALSVSPMDMDVGEDPIRALGWDWESLRATICASFTWTAASASYRGLRNFRWTACPPGPASRRARCRLSATAHGELNGVSPAPPPDRAGRP